MKKVILSMCMVLVTLTSYAYVVGDSSAEETGTMKPKFYCWKNKTLNSGNMKNAEIGILSGIDGKYILLVSLPKTKKLERNVIWELLL